MSNKVKKIIEHLLCSRHLQKHSDIEMFFFGDTEFMKSGIIKDFNRRNNGEATGDGTQLITKCIR